MDALPVGTVLIGNIYRYIIQEVLGQGTFGITYRASLKMEGTLGTLETHVSVAIKEFFMNRINGRDNTLVTGSKRNRTFSYYKEKFIKESLSISKLNHLNIVKVVEQFEANNTAYYVMEHIAGGSLDEKIISSGKLSETQIINYTRQIGAALQLMHSKHMLHLDLKPKNVMLTTDDKVKLIDFGLSKQFDDSGNPETSTTIGNGTPGYAPLEQANYTGDSGDFPATMDIYALGATMFKMATGHRPPDATDILNDGFPSHELTGVSDKMRSAIKKAMSPMKKERFQSMPEFINFLSDKQRNGNGTDCYDDENTISLDNLNKTSFNTFPIKVEKETVLTANPKIDHSEQKFLTKKYEEANKDFGKENDRTQNLTASNKTHNNSYWKWIILIFAIVLILFYIGNIINEGSSSADNLNSIAYPVDEGASLGSDTESYGAPLSNGEKEDGRGGFDDNAEGYFNMHADTYVTPNRDVYFDGDFSDSKGRYPITLKFELDDNWYAGTCYYHNVDYGTKLKMNVRFTEEKMIINGNAGGSVFVMEFIPTSDGKWTGTARNGNHKLEANIWPIKMP